MKSTILSILEFVSVFLLAVEAIKLENLSWLKDKSLKASDFLNPRIEFVENYTPPSTFIGRHIFRIFIAVNFLIALAILLWVGLYFDVKIRYLPPENAADWAAVFFMLLFTPMIGGIFYTIVLKILSLAVKALTWIENSTRSGVVGIIGFLFYAIQFFAK